MEIYLMKLCVCVCFFYRQCFKAYHPECVGKDDSVLTTNKRWICSKPHLIVQCYYLSFSSWLHIVLLSHKVSLYSCQLDKKYRSFTAYAAIVSHLNQKEQLSLQYPCEKLSLWKPNTQSTHALSICILMLYYVRLCNFSEQAVRDKM